LITDKYQTKINSLDMYKRNILLCPLRNN